MPAAAFQSDETAKIKLSALVVVIDTEGADCISVPLVAVAPPTVVSAPVTAYNTHDDAPLPVAATVAVRVSLLDASAVHILVDPPRLALFTAACVHVRVGDDEIEILAGVWVSAAADTTSFSPLLTYIEHAADVVPVPVLRARISKVGAPAVVLPLNICPDQLSPVRASTSNMQNTYLMTSPRLGSVD